MDANPSPTPFLQKPLVRLLTHGVMPLLAFVALLLQLWLAPKPVVLLHKPLILTYYVLGIYLSIGFTGILLLTSGITLAKRHTPFWLECLMGVCTLFALVTAITCDTFVQIIESNMLWQLPTLLFSTVCFGLLTPLIATLWQLVARPLRQDYSSVTDGILTLLGMIAIFFGGPFVAMLCFTLDIENEFFWLAGGVSYCILLLAGVLHLIWLIGRNHLHKMAQHRRYAWIWTLVVTLILPLTGLLLNLHTFFPGDLQSRWCYLLTLLTATSLLLPDGKGIFGKAIALWRWAMFPFTLYFFILFLPFIPLALPCLFLFGAGLLLLAPTLLLSVHVPALRRSAAVFRHKASCIAVAILGCALIPTIFIISVERDRAQVRPLIAAIATPDATASRDDLPMDEDTAKRITQILFDQTNRTPRFPLLNLWKKYRLFNGLTPSKAVLNSLAIRFNLSTRIASRQWWSLRSKQTPVTLTLRGESTCHLTVAIDIPAIEEAEEYRAPITVANGVWITGLRLKMPQNGPWREGLLCDRRAATWVYERLTERRIDPALLTLDTLTEGTLRVSPVTEARQVEIDLLLPSPNWCSTPFTIGDQAITLSNGKTDTPVTSTVATVCFIGPEAQMPLPKADLYVVGTPVITVSETTPETLPETGRIDVERAFLFARGNAYAKNLHLTQAVYAGKGWEKAVFTPMRPRYALPKRAPDEPWQQAAIAGQLAEACLYTPHPEYAAPLYDAMMRSKALMPRFAYIVVENETQERALRTLDVVAKQAIEGVDFVENTVVKQSTPTFWCLLLLFVLIIALREFCKSKRKRV